MTTIKHELISPDLAIRYLQMSGGNRSISADYVRSLTASMNDGQWDADASEIVFDADGFLIDGHHRLEAVVAHGQSVLMLVKRGVAASARGILDTGRPRSLVAMMSMFRPGGTHVHARKAILTVCVSLFLGKASRAPTIRTFDAYDAWYSIFDVGIAAAMEMTVAGPALAREFRFAPFVGAFAFAHKTNPAKVIALLRRTIDGTGLSRGEPAHTMRAILAPSSRRAGEEARMILARKTVNGIEASLHGRQYVKNQPGEGGMAFFRAAYPDVTAPGMMASPTGLRRVGR